jgi:hypothetical protein
MITTPTLQSVFRYFVFAITVLLNACTLAPPSPSFQFLDKRPAAEREGFPYPNSSFQYKMHGDKSLGVDRLQVLRDRFRNALGQELTGKDVEIHHYYVMEANLRNSFVRDASGKSVPNTGPFEPTLIATLHAVMDGCHFNGYAETKLPPNSKATHTTLMEVTDEAIQNALKDHFAARRCVPKL